MMLKFLKAVAGAGRQIYHAGKVYDIKDRHAAETYIGHGYAEEAKPEDKASAQGEGVKTLKR